MEEFIVLNQKPNIVYAYPKFISKWGANYFSVNRINMIKKIKKSNIEYDLLSNRVEIQNIRRIPKEKSSELYIGLADVNTQTGELTENNTINEGITGISNAVRKGQILFSKLRPNLNKVTICPQSINEALASTEFCIFEARNIDKYYLFAVLKSNVGLFQVIDITTGSTLPRLDTEDILNILIPIPSPEIQKYIGDKVRKAEELREEAKRLKKEAEEILNKELNLKDVEFYIKQTNNKKYSWTESIEIEDRIDSEFYKPKYRYLSKLNNMSELSYYYKISKKRINKNIDRKIKYIDLSSVNNIIEPSDFNTKELPSRAQFLVKEGNLIISTLKGSNKISIIPEHLNDSVCSTGFIVIASKSHLTTEYLYLVFSNKVFNMQIERYSTGSIMSGVNHDNFNKMLIPVISNKQIIDTITNKIRKHFRLLYYSKQLIQEAKQDVEDLIEGNFDMSKVKVNN